MPDKTDFSYKGGGKQIEDPAGKHTVFIKFFLECADRYIHCALFKKQGVCLNMGIP